MKVLVARCDRLGDLVLSLPVFAWLKQRRPSWEVHALVAAAATPLVENDPAIDAIYTWHGTCDPELERKLAEERYDAVLILQYQTELAAMLRRCGIRRRYGPLSRWSSWLLLNRGVVQGRSRVRRHESDYNLDLARRLAGRGRPAVDPVIHLQPQQREAGLRLRAAEAPGAEVLAFVHPSSGGSALDWEPEHFAAVANTLAARPGWRVWLTGSHHDRLVIDRLGPHLDPRVKVMAERFPLREFLGMLSAGDLMVAPSTGPLHMAAALGLAAVGLYPPAPTMSPRRWGPLGTWSRAVVPAVDCPAKRHCLLERCLLYNCLAGVRVAEVVTAAVDLVSRRGAQANER
jgi:ADP-heptose:LPS heptosyltransferase